MRKITIELSKTMYSLLEVLTKGEWAPAKTVQGVIEMLIDHAQQGVYRPGAWESNGWSMYSLEVGRNILSLVSPRSAETSSIEETGAALSA